MTTAKPLPFTPAACSALSTVAICLSLVGCAGTGLLNWQGSQMPQADETHPVRRIVCIWEPAEGTGLDGLPTRGFAGRILFFAAGNRSPVRVNGDVRIYLFDDEGTPAQRAKPIHQFDFLGNAWTIHLQESTLGLAYQVFIPYVGKQPWQTRSALRVRFVPKHGQTIFSEMVRVTLPGPTRPTGGKTDTSVSPTASGTGTKSKTPRLGAVLTRRHVSAVSLLYPTEGNVDSKSNRFPNKTPSSRSAGRQDGGTTTTIRLPTVQNPTRKLALVRSATRPTTHRGIEQALHESAASGRPAPNKLSRAKTPASHRRFRLAPATNPLKQPSAVRHPLADKPQHKHPLAEE